MDDPTAPEKPTPTEEETPKEENVLESEEAALKSDAAEQKKKRVRLVRRSAPAPKAEATPPKKRKIRLVRRTTPEDDDAEPRAPQSEDERPLSVEDDPPLFDASFEDEIDPQNPADSVARIASKIAETLLPKILKKAVASGSDILTEEGLRSILRDTPMPKELSSLLSGQVDSVREELYTILAREVRRFLDSLDLAGELQRILTSLSFEIRTEVRFIPNAQAVAKPKISNRVRVHRNKDDKTKK